MPDQSTIHNTFVIERSYPKLPERVFAAFADATKKRHWYAEGASHDVEQFEMEFRVGGAERLRYRFKEGTPFKGLEIANEGSYHDIVPNRRIVMSYAMTFGAARISVTLVTLEFLPTPSGTDLICTHQGAFFEGSDGPQIREAGWRTQFEKLAGVLAREAEN
jgi:uncharacterized protein YndB with AHSA1/START domain